MRKSKAISAAYHYSQLSSGLYHHITALIHQPSFTPAGVAENVPLADVRVVNLYPFHRSDHFPTTVNQTKVFTNTHLSQPILMVVKIQPKYSTMGSFGTNGLAMVEVVSPGHVVTKPKGRVGWIDVSGELVIPMEWQSSKDFDSSGLAAVQLKDKWGWIDESGKMVLPPKWDEVNAFDGRGVAGVNSDRMWGAINKEGELVIPLTKNTIEAFDKEGVARVASEFWPLVRGLVRADGRVLAEPEWYGIGPFDEQGHAWVAKSEKCGIIDREGNVIFLIPGQAAPYKAWEWFDRNDRAHIISTSLNGPDDKMGWLDRDGEVEIEHPKGWAARDWRGAYTMFKNSEVGWLKKGFNKVTGWITGNEPSGLVLECRTYDKDGNLIWSSLWMRKETKAWMWLIAALLPLLIVLWRGRRRGKVKDGGKT